MNRAGLHVHRVTPFIIGPFQRVHITLRKVIRLTCQRAAHPVADEPIAKILALAALHSANDAVHQTRRGRAKETQQARNRHTEQTDKHCREDAADRPGSPTRTPPPTHATSLEDKACMD